MMLVPGPESGGIAQINVDAEVLAVAGGGSGGYRTGGGGGAGELFYSQQFRIVKNIWIDITIGGGGNLTTNSGNGSINGVAGQDTIFADLTLNGGGGGLAISQSAVANGGSGGGGCREFQGGNSVLTGGGVGNAGGTAFENFNGAGGGGAGSAGSDSSATSVGNGGTGLEYSITGTAQFYAAGGGGGVFPIQGASERTPGTGGSGVGGDGSRGTAAGNGAVNTGSGGGGSGGTDQRSGIGGAGVVIIAYPSTEPDLIVSGNLTFDRPTRNGFKVYRFTAGTGAVTIPGTSPVVTIDTPIAGDGVVDASEANSVTVSGTATNATDGQEITLNFTDGINTVTASPTVTEGAWSAAGIDLSTLSDGEIEINAFITVPVEVLGAQTVQLNTLPMIINSATFSWGAVLEAGETATDGVVTVSIANPDEGQDVTLTMNGKTYTETVQASSTEAVFNIPAADLQDMPQHESVVSWTITSTDTAGNVSTPLTGSFEIDNTILVTALSVSGGQQSASQGDTVDFAVTFNQGLTVTGGLTATVNINGQDVTANYLSGSGTNRLFFRVDSLAAPAGSNATLQAIALGAGATVVSTLDATQQLTFYAPPADFAASRQPAATLASTTTGTLANNGLDQISQNPPDFLYFDITTAANTEARTDNQIIFEMGGSANGIVVFQNGQNLRATIGTENDAFDIQAQAVFNNSTRYAIFVNLGANRVATLYLGELDGAGNPIGEVSAVARDTWTAEQQWAGGDAGGWGRINGDIQGIGVNQYVNFAGTWNRGEFYSGFAVQIDAPQTTELTVLA